MKAKRILFATHRYLPAVSGSEVYFSQLAAKASDWADVKVMTLNVLKNTDYIGSGKPLPGKSVEKGIYVERYPVTNFFMKKRLFHFMESKGMLPYITGYSGVFSAGFSMAVQSAVSSCDAVITGAMPFTSIVYSSLRAARKAGKKSILVPLLHLGPERSERFRYEYFSKECEKLYSMSDAVIVLSSAEEEYFKSIGYSGDILRIEPYLSSFTSPKGGIKGKIRLFTMGFHNYEKGIETTLNIFRFLKKRGRDVTLKIAGRLSQEYRGEVLSETGIEHSEFLNDSEKEEAFRESDIFLLPSIAESFGIASMEANAHGLPAIGAYCSGTSSIIRNGRNGYLIQFGDYQAGAIFIEHLADNPDVYERMSRESYEFASGFTEKRFTEKAGKLKEILI